MAKNKKNANYVTEKTDLAKAQKDKTKRSKKTKGVAKNVLYVILAVAAIVVLITGFVHIFKACTKTEPREFLNPLEYEFEVTDIVELDFGDYGKVKIELYGKEAPETVANFKKKVEEGYFDSKYLTVSTSTSTEYVSFSHSNEKNEESDHDHDHDNHDVLKGEFYDNNFANRISHTYGVITMTRGTGYYSSTTDFMIITDDFDGDEHKYANEKTGYDGNNAAFGKVVSDDMAVIEKMVKDYQGKSDSDADDEDENALASGTNKIEITDDDIKATYIDRTFTPEHTGTYIFEAGSNFTGLIIDDGENEKLGTVEKYLVAGTEYKFRIAIKESAKAGTVNFKITDRIIEAGSNSISIVKQDKDNSKVFYYTYTAPVTAEYIFTLTSLKDVTISDKNGNKLEATAVTDNSFSHILTAGEIYTIEIPAVGAQFADNSSSVTGKINVDERYFEINEEVKIKFTQAEITNGTVVYSFVAGVDGKYIVTSKDIKEIKILDQENKELGTGYATLEAGKTYKLSMKTTGLTKDKEYKLQITEPKLTVGGTDVTILESDIEAKKVTYTFVAELSGKHVFSVDIDGTQNFRIYDSEGTLLNEYNETDKAGVVSKKIRPYAYFEKGKTYKIELEITSDFKKDTEYTISVDDPSLALNTATSSTSTSWVENAIAITNQDKAQKKITYVFTATTTCMYEFAIPTDMESYVSIYKNGEKLEKFDYLKLSKGDVCEVVIETESINITATSDPAVEASKKTTITVSKSYPQIAKAIVVNKTAK